MIRRIPGILSDIDGVLQRGLSPFSFTSDYINFWTKKLNLPFALLTNGGGQTENTRIKILNNRFKTKLRPDQIILCHSPFQDLYNLKDEYVLIGGQGDLVECAQNYSYKKFITIKELHSLIPEYNPLNSKLPNHDSDKINLLQRFQMGENELRKDINFKAVMIWTDVEFFELHLQLCSDTLISDGKIGHSIQQKNQQIVELIFSQNDITFPTEIEVPRLSGGIFKDCLQLVFDLQYNRKLEYSQYGKPTLRQFLFAEKVIEKQIQLRNFQLQEQFEISNLYMIGDNVKADIQGANNIKQYNSKYQWKSILVRTGIYKNGDDSNQADYIVNNFQEAIELICKIEGISINVY